MIAPLKRKPLTAFPRQKIMRIVETIIPKGRPFSLLTEDSGINRKQIVRIVTPAWKNLRPPERITKVLRAMSGQLSEAEENRVLRYSVLTPEEYQRVVVDDFIPSRSTTAAPKKMAAKRRKAALKPKRSAAAERPGRSDLGGIQ